MCYIFKLSKHFKQNIFLNVLVFFLLTIVVSLGNLIAVYWKFRLFLSVHITLSQILHQYVPVDTSSKNTF